MVHFLRRPMAAAFGVLCIGLFATFAQADPAGKWRIEFDHRTEHEGTITLRVIPEGGTAVVVETRIPAKTGTEDVAEAVRDSLKVSLGDGYHVETDDGEDVVVARKGNMPNFEVALAKSSLTGLHIKIKRE